MTKTNPALDGYRKMARRIMDLTGAKLEDLAPIYGDRIVCGGTPTECMVVAAYFVRVLKVDGVTIDAEDPEDPELTFVRIPVAGLEAALTRAQSA